MFAKTFPGLSFSLKNKKWRGGIQFLHLFSNAKNNAL